MIAQYNVWKWDTKSVFDVIVFHELAKVGCRCQLLSMQRQGKHVKVKLDCLIILTPSRLIDGGRWIRLSRTPPNLTYDLLLTTKTTYTTGQSLYKL